jgi:hypothetical protein
MDLWAQPGLLRGKRVRLGEAIGNAAVGKKRDPREVWFHRPQQCGVHWRLIAVVGRSSGHVSKRLSRWTGETIADRIDNNHIYDGNVPRDFSRRAGRDCADHSYQVDGSMDQFTREVKKPIRSAMRDSQLITDGLPLDEALAARAASSF